MKSIPQFRTNTPLTVEQYTQLDTAVKTAALSSIVARRVTPMTGPFGFGKDSISYDVLTHMSDATISYSWKVDAAQDLVNFTRTTAAVPVISKPFRVNARNLAASRTYGTPIDTANAKSAGYKVSLAEDELLFLGYKPDGTNYDINGFYPAAGNSYTTSKDFGTATNIPAAINGAIALFKADNITPPYNLVLNSAQDAEIDELIANGNGLSYRDWIMKRLGGGNVYMANAITAGTGLMMAAGDRGFFDAAIGVDLTIDAEELGLDQGHDLFGIAYETIVPRVFDSNSLCSLTQI